MVSMLTTTGLLSSDDVPFHREREASRRGPSVAYQGKPETPGRAGRLSEGPLMRIRNVVIGAVAAAVVVGVGVGAHAYLSREKVDPDVVKAEVTGIVSGDTLLVDLDGQNQTVHLLNVIAPKEEAGECLALESSQQLGILAPIGTEVRLAYAKGVEPKDTHGAEVFAGVYLKDGRLLNSEMA